MSQASAFVPGHVTAFFSAHPHDDPERAGSRGGGIALSDGVTVTVREGSGLRLNGDAIDVGAVDGVLDALGVDARVDCETALPLGSGFGVSGAMALGTALAANAAFDCARSENDLVTLAHRAEVEAGTGLGDVVAQARGGVPLRLDPGAPAHGRMDGIPARSRVEYLTLGGLSTEAVLSGDTDALSRAGERALDRVRGTPTLSTFVTAAREFADGAGLMTDDLRAVVADVEDAGGRASMAMLGETAFAVGTGLSDAGYDPEVCAVHPAGAHLLD
ncbi:pantoate kinase [Halorarius halobius]|uniref:pantoate kinase n=1 Tax=Halorarius halobius TaxID=2962671 RepID=UPI0020CFE0D7|nr:pantoate kinase [Halorarius halobius]